MVDCNVAPEKCLIHLYLYALIVFRRLSQATPHLTSKRKSLHGRKLRPKSVVDSVEGISADDIPDLLPSLQSSTEG